MIHKHFLLSALLFTAIVFVGCTNNETSQVENTDSKATAGATTVTFASENPETRTTISHTIGQGAIPYWSAGDKIWVKDNDGNFQQSGEGEFNSDKTRGVFTLSGIFSNGCTVHYTGANGTAGGERDAEQITP